MGCTIRGRGCIRRYSQARDNRWAILPRCAGGSRSPISRSTASPVARPPVSRRRTNRDGRRVCPRGRSTSACVVPTLQNRPCPALQKTPQSGAKCAASATDPPQSTASISPPDSLPAVRQSYRMCSSAPRAPALVHPQKNRDFLQSPRESSPADDPRPRSADPICAEKSVRE
jgi:hypothetical protein